MCKIYTNKIQSFFSSADGVGERMVVGSELVCGISIILGAKIVLGNGDLLRKSNFRLNNS